MSSALLENVDKSKQIFKKYKRKLSSNEDICDMKPKSFDTQSGDGSSNDSDKNLVKSSKYENLEKNNQNKNCLKEISSECHGGGDAENSSTVTKLKSNRLNMKNNEILALLNSHDSDVEYKNSDSDESLTVNNVTKKAELLEESGNSNSNSPIMKVLSKQNKLQVSCKSTHKPQSSGQESSDTECSSDNKPLTNKLEQVTTLDFNSEDSDFDSCLKSTTDENQCTKVLKVNVHRISKCINSSGELKPSRAIINTARIKRNSKPTLKIRSSNSRNEFTSDSSDDELLSKVSHSKKRKENSMSDDNESSKKLRKNPCKSVPVRKGVYDSMNEISLKYGEHLAKQKVGVVSDSGGDVSKSDSNNSDIKSSDERNMGSKKSKQRKKYRASFKKSKISNSNNINNDDEDESCDKSDIDSNEEVQENPKAVKLKKANNAQDVSEENHNKLKEKSPELKFQNLRSESDTESSVVCSEDAKEHKPRKLIQASENPNSEEETSDKEDNLKSLVVKHEISSSESDSDQSGLKNSPNENVRSVSNQKHEHMKSKKAPKDNKRIITLKKYVHIAGLRPNNYVELWKGCRTNKARVAKLLQLLETNGLKGKPTIEKCKKLRIKIESKKEIAELDLGNIIDNGEVPRSRRCTRGVLGNTSSRLSAAAEEKADQLKKRFSRIKALNSSDSESD